MAKNVKVKLLEEGSHLGRKGDVVEVPETMLPHLTQLRHIHDGTRLKEYRMAALLDESGEAIMPESAQVDIADMTQAEMEAAGLQNVAGGNPADVGAVNEVAAEKAAAKAADKAPAEEKKSSSKASKAAEKAAAKAAAEEK